MKIFIFLFLLPLMAAPVFAQQTAVAGNCCHRPATMAGFSEERAFGKAHPRPATIRFSPQGEMVSFPTADGKPAQGYAMKATAADAPVLLVYHEWWGLNDHIRAEVETWFRELDGKVTVLAPDLYDGEVADTRQRAASLMQALTEARATAIVEGAFAWGGNARKLGSIGWCFGGSWSLKSALLAGPRAGACVMYYGMPVQDSVQLRRLQTDVLGIFAAREKWISPQVVADFQRNMLAAGRSLAVHSYDAEHAFANPSNPGFTPDAAREAHTLALAYLRKRLLE